MKPSWYDAKSAIKELVPFAPSDHPRAAKGRRPNAVRISGRSRIEHACENRGALQRERGERHRVQAGATSSPRDPYGDRPDIV
jgi:hypothetical protein